MTWLYATLFTLLVAVPWVWGMIDLYTMYRFGRDNGGDKTAAALHWIGFKWSWVSQSKKIVQALPFFKQDLTELFGIREDDGRVT